MTLAVNNVISWADFSSICLNSIKSVCCNIDSFDSNVPARLKSGAQTTWVASVTTSKSGGNSGWKNAPYTYNWSVEPRNLISIVASSTVNSEWSTFLNAAGINARSNKLISAHDFALAVGLYMQFMSFHIKSIYSRRQAYNTVETQTTYSGNKYITGSCTPKYVLGAPNANPNNDSIYNAISQNIQGNQLFSRCNNPSPTTHVLI